MRKKNVEPLVKKSDLARAVAEILVSNGYTKTVRDTKHTFHVTDNDGNRADFVVKKASRPVRLTAEDAEAVIDALVVAMKEAIKQGFKIYLHDFGTIKLIYRKERSSIHPITKKKAIVPAHYYPRFLPGDSVRLAVKLYEQSLNEKDGTDQLEGEYEEYDDIELEDMLVDEESEDGETVED